MNEQQGDNMLLDAIRWNMLNVIRVELFFDCYKLWTIYDTSSLQSTRGQYAIISLLITIIAQLAVQFNLSWILTIYSVYLLVGLLVWVQRRVRCLRRSHTTEGAMMAIRDFELARMMALGVGSTSTLKPDKHHHHHHKESSSSSNGSSSANSNGDANSLGRHKSSYREMQNIAVEPRRSHREFAVSLDHLSQISKLVADEDVFDEIKVQLLATRLDVINVVLRLSLLTAASLLAFFR